MNILKESPEVHTPDERNTLENIEETPEAHSPEERNMLELEESPEAHTPEASGTIDSAPGIQDRTEASGTGDVTRDCTDVRQARASRRELKASETTDSAIGSQDRTEGRQEQATERDINPMPKRQRKKETKREAPPRKKVSKQEE